MPRVALLGLVQQPDLIVARIDGVQLSHGLVRALLASESPTPLSPRPDGALCAPAPREV
jgi:hypothetical protein